MRSIADVLQHGATVRMVVSALRSARVTPFWCSRPRIAKHDPRLCSMPRQNWCLRAQGGGGGGGWGWGGGGRGSRPQHSPSLVGVFRLAIKPFKKLADQNLGANVMHHSQRTTYGRAASFRENLSRIFCAKT